MTLLFLKNNRLISDFETTDSNTQKSKTVFSLKEQYVKANK